MATDAISRAPSSRSTNACDQCRRRKVKCSGTRPCRPCARRKVECTIGGAGRQRYSDAYVQTLLRKIRAYEGNSQETAPGVSDAQAESPVSQDGGPQKSPGVRSIDPNPLSRTESASGPAFASQVRSLFGQQSPASTCVSTTNASNPMGSPVPEFTNATLTFALPSEAESMRLLDLFLNHIGTAQHFLDPRTFSDSLALLYRGPETREAQMATMWFTQYLLVIALAKLVDIETTVVNGEPPGGEFFREAMRRLPGMQQLPSCGVVGVELLCLVGVYLQWCDRKRDAYFYIGGAVRLAIALGCSLPASQQDCLPSERAHRTRVWWTAYMLDRRISAALGLPAAADDRQLAFELPAPARGFPSPDSLNIKVRIAHATGEIMASLYGNSALSEDEFVAKIQSVLRSLNETRRDIPAMYVLDFSSPQMSVDRTSASLYLMLFQAIILCIRPVVLRKVKEKLDSRPLACKNPTIANIFQSCKDAAKKSIRILRGLQDNKQISRFGFFDLDATFSAAFILIMAAFIQGGSGCSQPSDLQEAIVVLEYLADEGNKVALQRLTDIKEFSTQVLPGQEALQQRRQECSAVNEDGIHSTSDPWSHLQSPGVVSHAHDRDAFALHGSVSKDLEATIIQGDGAGELGNVDMMGDMELDFDWEASGIFSSFHDPGLPVTGVDRVDWEEMERMFATREF